MSLLRLASSLSAWRGYEYFKEKKVLAFNSLSSTEIEGKLKGSGDRPYEVFIDIGHPRKSKCNCPHADGKRIICKHMIALFFSAFPEEAETYYNELLAYEKEAEKYKEELERKVMNYIRKLKKEELQSLVHEFLFDGPEWQYDRFVRRYIE